MEHRNARLAHFYRRAERWMEIENSLDLTPRQSVAARLVLIREQLTLFQDNLPEWKIFKATLWAGWNLNTDEINWLSSDNREQLYHDVEYDKWVTDASY